MYLLQKAMLTSYTNRDTNVLGAEISSFSKCAPFPKVLTYYIFI